MRLASSVDRSFVPGQDFELKFRDSGFSLPSVIASASPSGRHVVNLRLTEDSNEIDQNKIA